MDNKKYTINFLADVEVTVMAKNPEEAREKAEKKFGEYTNKTFEYAYLAEIKGVTDENGNEV